MANTTYPIPVLPKERAEEAMVAIFQHVIGWKQRYNIDFVSCVRNGANFDVTFSDPVPKAERDVIKLTLA